MKNNNLNKLEWEDKYSVGVAEIDGQHKKMFDTINQLINVVSVNPTKEALVPIIEALVEYKEFHFATEEKYFKEFNYEGAKAHIGVHREFGEKLRNLREKYKDDAMSLTYGLVDFLEDWLLEHLMTKDQEYVECFRSHGLK
jgi:hemerythrin-like metal-binding protein